MNKKFKTNNNNKSKSKSQNKIKKTKITKRKLIVMTKSIKLTNKLLSNLRNKNLRYKIKKDRMRNSKKIKMLSKKINKNK